MCILLLFSLLGHEDSLGYNSLNSTLNCSSICDLLDIKLENLEMLNWYLNIFSKNYGNTILILL